MFDSLERFLKEPVPMWMFGVLFLVVIWRESHVERSLDYITRVLLDRGIL